MGFRQLMLDILYDALAHYVVLEVPDTGFFLGPSLRFERVRAMDTKMRLPKQAMELWLGRFFLRHLLYLVYLVVNEFDDRVGVSKTAFSAPLWGGFNLQ